MYFNEFSTLHVRLRKYRYPLDSSLSLQRMNYQLSVEEKKNRPSFWGKLFGTSKKSSSKDKKDGDSFQRQSPLYHSFHFTSGAQESSDSQEEAGNFTTLENSAFMEMHRDSGIIFLNKNSIANCVLSKEEDRHVQFAPTPMNKYYSVDVKSAPARWTKNDENKENVKTRKTPKPAKPILRRSKENLSHKESLSDVNKDASKIKVNVSYIDGPEVKKTPNIPRTSTKLALFDRKNGSLPHLNVSNIAKYGSLPRTAKERFLSENTDNTSSHSGNAFHKLFFPQADCNQGGPTYNNVPQEELQTLLPQSREKSYCFSNPELPRQKNQRQFPQQPRPGSNPNRLSMGEPIRCGTLAHPEIEPRNLVVCYDPNCEVLRNQLRMKCPVNSVPVAGKQNNFHVPRQKYRQANSVSSTQQEDRGIVCHLPNKAFNEIGLPIITHESCKSSKHRSRSESPHYIPLSETYSSDKPARLKNDTKKNPPKQCQAENCNFVKPNIPFQTHDSQNLLKGRLNGHPNCFRDIPVLKAIENRDKTVGNDSQYFSQAKRQAIRSSMYVQKRRFVNKICKYKSKECEDGFSSMADDECSFNCSCSSCLAKFSRQYRKNMNKNTLGVTDDDKYFFIQTEDEQNMRGLPSVPEVSAEDDVQNKTAETQDARDQGPNTTWYECNDSLCKTPVKENVDSKENSVPENPQDVGKIIYENITHLINSATKQNFKPQDVKRLFSTPISTTKLKRELEKSVSGKKISRALFSPADSSSTSGKGRQRQLLSPAKSPVVFSDSVILLQEIFQKLSQECKELLQPGVSSSIPQQGAKKSSPMESGSKYINSLVKNLSSKEISEGDFANIIGGIAQNIFLEAKLKSKTHCLTQSASLPDLTKDATPTRLKNVTSFENMTSFSGLCKDEDALNTASDSGFKTDSEPAKPGSSVGNSTLEDRVLPDGWSKTPTTISNSSGSAAEKSSSEKETSRCSESEMQLLEDVIRLGMGLSPIRTVEKSTFYAASPAKASKFKSKDVLSCKGKLKLKIYNNSGLVTVHVARAAKLNRPNSRELNPYIKISMVPDSSKRVHWRTTVQKGQKNPVFNQKFSFEVMAEDSTKRLVFSVWHRDFAKERSELVGCMSFSVRHVLDETHKIDGWYRLLREGFGTQKHFAAHRKNPCSSMQIK
ncbi:unnamed protein product [Larinioides sclopetarius]|uniref:C2 domain-containing protein n=1 Tax=Larinioides sclopetarius TaxID=280406 RepID=A0AAV2ATL4_9ARAC